MSGDHKHTNLPGDPPDLYIIHLQQKVPPHILLEPPFKDAQLFPSVESDFPHDSSLVFYNKQPTRPWYKKKRFIFGAVLTALIIILIVLLATLLGTRKISVAYAFYSFDQNVVDLYRNHDGKVRGGMKNYIDDYIGTGQAILVNDSSTTWISIGNSFNFNNTNFTIEAFIFLLTDSINASLVQFSSGMSFNINISEESITLFVDDKLSGQIPFLPKTISNNENVTLTIDYGFQACPFYSTSFENPCDSGLLEIIGQPCYTSKLRYRSDYVSKTKRRGVLHSTNNPNYQYPTIRIPRQYMIPTDEHYICISLVTVENETTKYRYVHPYELEDVDNQGYHDRNHNSIWYSIQMGDIDGIKSFPNLRIVKKKAADLKNYGNLQVFNCLNNESSSQLLSIKDTIKEFNLEKAQLAISIGKKATNTNDNDTIWIIYNRTTVLSDELIQQFGKESYANCTPSGTSSVRFNSSEESDCRVYKYAPKFSYADSSDEILIFYTNRLQLKKYGELQVTFEFEGPNDKWTEPALELEVIDRMVSFRAPIFPFLINCATTVNIILT
ncbi:unnamed protein product, partial [Rotaria socialis]